MPSQDARLPNLDDSKSEYYPDLITTTTTAPIVGPPEICSVFLEEFLGTGFVPPNPTYWIEQDGPGILGVDNNRLEKRQFAEQADVHVRSTYRLGGDFDCQVEFVIQSQNANSGLDDDQYYRFRLPVSKNTWQLQMHTPIFEGLWSVESQLAGTAPDDWGINLSPPFRIWLRMTRVGTVFTHYVWRDGIDSEWNWAGNPAGRSFDSGISAPMDLVYVGIFRDGQGPSGENSWFGWVENFCINAGLWTPP